jgi:hypothetical protein
MVLPQGKARHQPALFVLLIVFTEDFGENGEPDYQYDI